MGWLERGGPRLGGASPEELVRVTRGLPINRQPLLPWTSLWKGPQSTPSAGGLHWLTRRVPKVRWGANRVHLVLLFSWEVGEVAFTAVRPEEICHEGWI